MEHKIIFIIRKISLIKIKNTVLANTLNKTFVNQKHFCTISDMKGIMICIQKLLLGD